ncbi:MAG: SNF2-related protein [Candidatus Competibacteraceae bacterium]
MNETAAPPDKPRDAQAWVAELNRAFAGRHPHPLELADRAVRECPKDAYVLELAAIAALVEEKPDRCLRYLKRLEKHFVTDQRESLLQALALAQQGRLAAALDGLKKAGLNTYQQAIYWFVGGVVLHPWLYGWLQKIYFQHKLPSRQVAGKTPARKPAGKVAPASKIAPPRPAPATIPLPDAPELPLRQPDIPIHFELNLPQSIGLEGENRTEADSRWFRLRTEFAHLGLLQGFDELFCLPQLHQVQTYWYQVETVRKVLKTFRGRVLLADEVGLGKTIEAGMTLKEYLLRGMVEKVLILTPASLVGQWQEEMASKFDIACASSYDALLKNDPAAFWAQPQVIASIATARRQEHVEHLSRQTYDLVIVDEAHHLKNRASQNYKLVDALQKRFLLLLSATPVQNSLVELYNLLTLLKPGIFKTEKEFRAAYMTPGKPRTPINRERLRDLMRDVMIRNTRALVDVRLPLRHAVTLRLTGGDEERACYQELDTLVREAHAGAPGHHRLALRHLLSAAGSSPAAATAAVHRFAGRNQRSWQALHERYGRLDRGVKENALLELLQRNPEEKKMVFVHHRETLNHLDTLLGEQGIAFARFEGSLPGPDKDAVIADFRERTPVLLSTESGGEGRNVQFCNTLINFDLPWNPMAIEQRIGRIHRIGQTREVFIFNLVAEGTLESQVLRILDEKINMFELVVGEIDAILGELDEQQDFAEMVFNTWVETTGQRRSEAFEELGEQLIKARQQYEAVKELDTELFGEEFETA